MRRTRWAKNLTSIPLYPSARPCLRGPHLPDPPLPEGEEGERQMKKFVFFSPLSLWERGARGVRASEGAPLRASRGGFRRRPRRRLRPSAPLVDEEHADDAGEEEEGRRQHGGALGAGARGDLPEDQRPHHVGRFARQ